MQFQFFYWNFTALKITTSISFFAICISLFKFDSYITINRTLIGQSQSCFSSIQRIKYAVTWLLHGSMNSLQKHKSPEPHETFASNSISLHYPKKPKSKNSFWLLIPSKSKKFNQRGWLKTTAGKQTKAKKIPNQIYPIILVSRAPNNHKLCIYK